MCFSCQRWSWQTFFKRPSLEEKSFYLPHTQATRRARPQRDPSQQTCSVRQSWLRKYGDTVLCSETRPGWHSPRRGVSCSPTSLTAGFAFCWLCCGFWLISLGKFGGRVRRMGTNWPTRQQNADRQLLPDSGRQEHKSKRMSSGTCKSL